MYMNYMQNNPCNCKDNYMEEDKSIYNDICEHVKNYNSKCYDECECGFEEMTSSFPDSPNFGQSYVPWQMMNKTFKPEVGLQMGTIFPELVSPYAPGGAQEDMEYLEATNKIGEGCNR